MTQLLPASGSWYWLLECTCVHSVFAFSWWRGSVVRTSVFGQRTFHPALDLQQWVPTNVGKLSATGQPTRPSQPFYAFGVDKWVVSCNWMSVISVGGSDIWWMVRRKGRHGVFAGKTVWSMPERFEIICSINVLYKYSFLSFSFTINFMIVMMTVFIVFIVPFTGTARSWNSSFWSWFVYALSVSR